MSADSLTAGAIPRMFHMSRASEDPAFQPTLQAIQIKAVSQAGAPTERFRIILSDGTHYVQGMLTTQQNALVTENRILPHSIVRINDFMNNNVQGRTVIILLKLDVIELNVPERLGNPTDFEKENGGAAAAAGNSNVAAQPMYNRTNKMQQSQHNSAHVVKPEGVGSNNPYGSRGSNPYGGGGSAPIVRSNPAAGGAHFTPISALNMYQNRWTIKARVTSKSDIKTWSNAKGEGSLFSMELLDGSGTDIRCTFFKEAVDKFYCMLEEGKVYRFSGGRMKIADPKWNTCKSGFEITFDSNAEIAADNDDASIRHQNYDFVPDIAHLEQVEANKNVDVLAIVKSVGDVTNLISKKSGQELTKCDLVLVDHSGVEINLTLWGNKAVEAPQTFAGHPVVAFRRCRVSDYGGKSMSLSGSADIAPQDLPQEVQRLQNWWSSGGKTGAGSKSLSSTGGMGRGAAAPLAERKTIASIKNEGLGHNDRPDYISFKGTVSFLKKDKEGGAWYPACSNSGEPCKNMFKVTQTTDGNWFCDKCQGTYPDCCRRWIFSGTVEDDTASTWVSFFNDQAQTLLGGETTANDAFSKFMEHNQDQDGYDSLFYNAQYTEWVFRCKVKTEMVNDEQRVKASVVGMHPVDYVKDSYDLINQLQQWAV